MMLPPLPPRAARLLPLLVSPLRLLVVLATLLLLALVALEGPLLPSPRVALRRLVRVRATTTAMALEPAELLSTLRSAVLLSLLPFSPSKLGLPW